MKESQRKAMFARFKLNYRTPNGINYKTINYGTNYAKQCRYKKYI